MAIEFCRPGWEMTQSLTSIGFRSAFIQCRPIAMNRIVPVRTPVLTIIIPTYNRADCLELLLSVLSTELQHLEEKVRVIIGDNASSDRTTEITAAFVQAVPNSLVLRHEVNLGPEENFCKCIEQADSEYFWIIGDDDIPRFGSIARIVSTLEQCGPDILYLSSVWVKSPADSPLHRAAVTGLDLMSMKRAAFAAQLNVWLTFISGIVVRGKYARGERLRHYLGTQLPQLSWVLNALKNGDRFICARSACVIATAGNSGGYSVIKVFGGNFPSIIKSEFSAPGEEAAIGRKIIELTALSYLPGLVWNLRQDRLGNFDRNENVSGALDSGVINSWGFRLFINPVSILPDIPAKMTLRLSQITARVLLRIDSFLNRIRGHAVKIWESPADIQG